MRNTERQNYTWFLLLRTTGQQRSHFGLLRQYYSLHKPNYSGLCQRTARGTAMSVLRDCRKQGGSRGGGVKIVLTTASLAIRNSAQFAFICANRGKQPRRIGNTHVYTAGSSLWACTHQWYSRTESNKYVNMGTHNRQKGGFSQLILYDSLWLAVSLQAWNISLIFCCFHVQITVKNQMWNTFCSNITQCGWTNSCSISRMHAYKQNSISLFSSLHPSVPTPWSIHHGV